MTSERRKKGGGTSATVALFALDDRLQRAQESLLKAYGYRVVVHDSFEGLLSLNPEIAACISIDLYGTGMSPTRCLARIRNAGLGLPVILLSGDLPRVAGRSGEVGPADGGFAYLLLQPVDIDLYLTALRSAVGAS